MKNYSMLEFAFIGDAIHTLYVRENIVQNQNLKMNEIHKISSKFCSAKTQSLVLDKIFPLLKEEEIDIIRKARNTKTKHIAKNANPADYHKATSFEALVGWLYVSQKNERLEEILKISMEEI